MEDHFLIGRQEFNKNSEYAKIEELKNIVKNKYGEELYRDCSEINCQETVQIGLGLDMYKNIEVKDHFLCLKHELNEKFAVENYSPSPTYVDLHSNSHLEKTMVPHGDAHSHDSCLNSDSSALILNTQILDSYDKTKGKWLKCAHCNFQTNVKQTLERHILYVHEPHNIKWFQCEQCNYQSKTKHSLQRHILHVHEPHKLKWIKCDHCDFQTKCKRNLQGHIFSIHSNKKIPPWDKCNQSSLQTKFKHDTEEHDSCHDDEQKPKVAWLKCEYCSYQAKRKDILRQHTVRLHEKHKANWLKCDHCSYQTVRKWDIRRHISSKHKKTSEKCNSVKESVKQYKCEYCNYEFRRKDCLKQHILEIHEEYKINWLKCNSCTYQAKRKWDLRRHILSKHKELFL